MPLYKIKNKLILFIHIPKTAGLSIHNFLAAKGALVTSYDRYIFDVPCSSQHHHSDVLKQYLVPESIDYCFTIVRNPLDRLISEFKYRHRAPIRSMRIPPKFIKRRLLHDMSDNHRNRYFAAWTNNCFKRYQKDPFHLFNHIRPQSQFTEFPNARIFKLEDQLSELRESLGAILDLKIDAFPSDNVSESFNLQADLETRERIFDFYREDYARLPYRLPQS